MARLGESVNSKKKTICVTGSSGFIGSHLLDLLSKNQGFQVLPFSGDLLNKEDISKFFGQNKNIDIIIHLVGLFNGTFEDLTKVNVIALSNLLEAATANQIKKIIYTSTGAVYGEPAGLESKEDDPLLPNTLYGLSKKQAEDLIKYYGENFGFDYVILRFPNVYGENNSKGVVFSFLKDIKEKRKVTIHGDGKQSRNFLHVSDACESIMLAIDYKSSGIFNISNPSKVSILDLINCLKEEYVFEVDYEPSDNNLKDLLLNIDKAKSELGFEPKIKKIKLDLQK